jgi:hypothetical protein
MKALNLPVSAQHAACPSSRVSLTISTSTRHQGPGGRGGQWQVLWLCARGHSRSISCTVTGSLVVTGPPGPVTLCARTRNSNRAPVGRSFTSNDVCSVSPCRAATHSESGVDTGESNHRLCQHWVSSHCPPLEDCLGPSRGRGWSGSGYSLCRALTALLAVLHTVAVQTTCAHALWRPPLERDRGVRHILHCQVGGFTRRACKEGLREALRESTPAGSWSNPDPQLPASLVGRTSLSATSQALLGILGLPLKDISRLTYKQQWQL